MVAEFLVLGPQPWRHPGTVEGSHDSPRPMGRHPHVDDVGRRTPGAGRGGSDTDQENASTTARLMQRSDVEDTLRPLQSHGVIYQSELSDPDRSTSTQHPLRRRPGTS